jgi:hypothetical protein
MDAEEEAMKGWTRFTSAVAASVWLAGLFGCGGGGVDHPGGPGTLPTPPPPPVTHVVDQDSFVVDSHAAAGDVFSITSTGTLGATVDWTFPTNDVDLFLVRGSNPCTLQTFVDRSCGFLSTAETVSAKPEKLSIANLAPGTYTLYVANFGETAEAVSCQIVLTTATGASGSVTSQAVGGPPIAKRRLERIMVPRSVE